MPPPIGDAEQRSEERLVGEIRRLVKRSRAKSDAFRRNREEAIRNFCGMHYGTGFTQSLPINLIASSILAITPQLAPGVPKPGLAGKSVRARQLSGLMNQRLEEWTRETGFDETFELLVADALFGFGCTWTGWAAGHLVEIGDEVLDAGNVLTRRVSPDDLLLDPRARRFCEATFIGHEAEVPVDWARETFENTEQLRPMAPGEGESRTLDEGRLPLADSEICPTCRVYTIWWPKGLRGTSGPLLTVLPREGQGNRFLRIEDYRGPEHGPYDFLQYHRVPDLVFPLPPVAAYMDLHRAVNEMARKLVRRIGREKVLALLEQAMPEDEATAIRDAGDGDTLRVSSIDRAKELRLGGTPPQTYQEIDRLIGFGSRMAGNTDLAGGLSPSAPTLGQEQILAGGVQARLGWMRRRIRRLLKGVYGKAGWYLWSDPLDDRTLGQTVPGTNLEVQVRFTPEMRDVDFEDFDIDAEPYAQREQHPDAQADRMEAWLSNVVAPLFEIATAQGAEIDAGGIIQRLGELRGIGQMGRLFRMAGETPPATIGPFGPAGQGGAGGQQSPGGRPGQQPGARPGVTVQSRTARGQVQNAQSA